MAAARIEQVPALTELTASLPDHHTEKLPGQALTTVSTHIEIYRGAPWKCWHTRGRKQSRFQLEPLHQTLRVTEDRDRPASAVAGGQERCCAAICQILCCCKIPFCQKQAIRVNKLYLQIFQKYNIHICFPVLITTLQCLFFY